MGLNLLIENTREINDGVWVTKLVQSELATLGTPTSEIGNISVILVQTNTIPQRDSDSLAIPANETHLLNRGRGDSTMTYIILDAPPSRTEGGSPRQEDPYSGRRDDTQSNGDRRFLQDLPRHLSDLGNKLLHDIRCAVAPDGHLVYYADSGRYIEKPDNFWAVKIQPRKGDLVVTVRGTPDHFAGIPSSITVTKDRTGYSQFHLSRDDQVADAVAVIERAVRKT